MPKEKKNPSILAIKLVSQLQFERFDGMNHSRFMCLRGSIPFLKKEQINHFGLYLLEALSPIGLNRFHL